MPEPAPFKVTFSRPALKDIEEARAFVSRVSRGAADRLVLDIRDATARLGSLPDRGHHHAMVTDPQVRAVVVRGAWLVLYRRTGARVQIVRVVRGDRDLSSLDIP